MLTTEQDSLHPDLDQRSIPELLDGMNREDQKVARAVHEILPQLHRFLEQLIPRMKGGGRLFYLGSGTSGRLGIVDASECPPTFGVSHDLVVGIIAGGDGAIRQAVEFAEDDREQGWIDLMSYRIGPPDTLVGISASGRTPYVLGAIGRARAEGILTAGIACNRNSALGRCVAHPIEVDTGPEFLTGSTRLKAGTAQKMILNMITTTAMIGLGRVKGNRMVDMQLTNHKLIDRGTRMIMAEKTHWSAEQARDFLQQHGNVRSALEALSGNPS